MKKLLFLGLFIFSSNCFSQIISIPDANFKSKLLSGNNASFSESGDNFNSNVDTNNDGEIQISEAEAITGLKLNTNVSSTNGDILSLEGIAYFTNLKHFECKGNQISGSLNLSVLTNLTYIHCAYNEISELNVSGLSQLETLNCYNNNITSINTTGLTSLKTLSCHRNNIVTIDTNTFTALKEFNISKNNLTELDITPLSQLEYVICSFNELTSLIVPNSLTLEQIYADDNILTSINLTGLSNLTHLFLSNNSITSINTSNLTNLRFLTINNNPIENIDLSNNALLEALEINSTLISVLDCSETNASYIHASDNPNLISVNIQNGTLSLSDPDLLAFALYFENLPELTSICIDNGEQSSLVYTDYNMNGNVIVYTGENCEDIITVGLSNNELSNYKMYPNPTSSILNIESAYTFEDTSIEIYNTSGQLLKKETFTNNTVIRVDISNLIPNVYFIKIISDNKETTQKFIKM